jgi:acetyl-CoA C-acetyltransferase
MAAQRIVAGEGDVYVAGGVESISCVQQEMNTHMLRDMWLAEHKPEIYWSMLQTAETSRSATRSRRSARIATAPRASSAPARRRRRAPRGRDRPDHPSPPAWPTRRRACARSASRSPSTKACAAGTPTSRSRTSAQRLPGGVITAGNASQFSDGAGACAVVSSAYAERKNCRRSGRFLGFAVAGCEPDEMGIGPVFAVPKVLKRLGLTVADIDLWS